MYCYFDVKIRRFKTCYVTVNVINVSHNDDVIVQIVHLNFWYYLIVFFVCLLTCFSLLELLCEIAFELTNTCTRIKYTVSCTEQLYISLVS